MRAFYSRVQAGHDPSFELVSGRRVPAYEVPQRAAAILAALAAEPEVSIEEPPPALLEPLLAVHDSGLVRYLESAWDEWIEAGLPADGIVPDTFLHPGFGRHISGANGLPEPRAPDGRVGRWCFDSATVLVAGSWPAARAAAGVALAAAGAVVDGERLAYGLCRPPGHHASRGMFGGYCLLNNAAIAAEWLVARGAGRVGILDLDYHHGNGTQDIFWDRGDVAYASIHADPDLRYPYFSGRAEETGDGPGAGATFNQPMPAGLDGAGFRRALERALDWLGDRHDGIVVVSLGLDTYRLDPLGDFALDTGDYRAAGALVAAAGGRLVVLQEGGYFLPDLGANAAAWLRGARRQAGVEPTG